MYTVYQHWDPLKVCIVGRSYPPEFYSFIKNSRVRTVMERIAQETEEDYQKLIKLLESFNVKVLRPTLKSIDYNDYLGNNGKIIPPPMTPRDYSAMIGNDFYTDYYPSWQYIQDSWPQWRGKDWPINAPNNIMEFNQLPKLIIDEIAKINPKFIRLINNNTWVKVIEEITPFANVVLNRGVNSAITTRVGKDLYFGTENYNVDPLPLGKKYRNMFPDYRCHVINTGGHADGTYCPVKPGLIVSLEDAPTYAATFPDWEVVYLPAQSWDKVWPFLKLKRKNKGKWWVPGEELNDEFTDFVEGWLNHWVGYVEETVFDVNMLVIDEKNVVCNNYNKDVFDAFERHGVTPHVINFRHRYFWDGGLHCITSDIHREGTMKDYFPERG